MGVTLVGCVDNINTTLHLRRHKWRDTKNLGLCPPWARVESGTQASYLHVCNRVVRDGGKVSPHRGQKRTTDMTYLHLRARYFQLCLLGQLTFKSILCDRPQNLHNGMEEWGAECYSPMIHQDQGASGRLRCWHHTRKQKYPEVQRLVHDNCGV
jgi:hypothetical protein